MIYGVFGKPRSGKSTFLARYVARVLRTRQLAQLPLVGRFYRSSRWYYDLIYSTHRMAGCILVDPYDIGKFEPVPGCRSLIVIHEAGIAFNNRNFKSIPQYCTDFFAEHGHYDCDIFYDSQTVDIDKKLRNRTQHFYVVSKCPLRRWRSKVVRVKYWIGVNKEAQRLDECYTEPMGFLESLVARLTHQVYTFNRRPFYRFFDSYSRDLDFDELWTSDMPSDPYPRWKSFAYLIFRLATWLLVLVVFGILLFRIFVS